MAKTQTFRAVGGQRFFGLPAFSGTPSVTVNGIARTFTANASGVVLSSAATQDDTVAITFDPVDSAGPRAEFFSPTTGQTISPTKFANFVGITPAATIAALTINFPPSPDEEGQEFRVLTSKTITAVTFSGGSALNAPTTLAANKSVSFAWSVAKQEWVRTI